MTALDAVLSRRSQPKVSDRAPTHEELLPLVAAAATVADHGSLQPWRLIELRGDARARLGAAMAEADGATGKDALKLAEKPMRASLLIAIVYSHQRSHKVDAYEQEAVASGVAHTLSLLLDEAGWGVMWRTGHLTRSSAVRRMHRLGDNEDLLGWLYVGAPGKDSKSGSRKPVDAEKFLSSL